MIEEIIYTSAPQGLKPGSKGFCTVASSPGMASTLATLLESLSGYRHLAEPGTAQTTRNPPVFSHLKARVGGRNVHILSRIADAGLDYSGRSNKIAHHVVLNAQNLPPAGPAAVQLNDAFHETSWSGQPRLLTVARQPLQTNLGPAVCHHWKELTGDAGWGGVCAERFARSQPNAIWMIVPVGVDVLRLIGESLVLLPPVDRWNATYTTFYTKIPPGVDCRLRCAIDGTVEAEQLRKRHELDVLDLSRPPGRAPENQWAEVGRSGMPVDLDLPVSNSQIGNELTHLEPAIDDAPYEIELAEVAIPAPPPLPMATAEHRHTLDDVREPSSSIKRGRVLALRFIVLAVLLIVVLVGAFVWIIRSGFLPSEARSNTSRAGKPSTIESDAAGSKESATTEVSKKDALIPVHPKTPRLEETRAAKYVIPPVKESSASVPGSGSNDDSNAASAPPKDTSNDRGQPFDESRELKADSPSNSQFASHLMESPFENEQVLFPLDDDSGSWQHNKLKPLPVRLRKDASVDPQRFSLQLLRPLITSNAYQISLDEDSKVVTYGQDNEAIIELHFSSGVPQLEILLSKSMKPLRRALEYSQVRLIYDQPDSLTDYYCTIKFRLSTIIGALPVSSGDSGLFDDEHWTWKESVGDMSSFERLYLRSADLNGQVHSQSIKPSPATFAESILAIELPNGDGNSLLQFRVAARRPGKDKVIFEGRVFNSKSHSVINLGKLDNWQRAMQDLSSQIPHQGELPISSFAQAEQCLKLLQNAPETRIAANRGVTMLRDLKAKYSEIPDDLEVEQLTEWMESHSIDYELAYGIETLPQSDRFIGIQDEDVLHYGVTRENAFGEDQ